MHSPVRWHHNQALTRLSRLISIYVDQKELGRVGIAKVLVTLTRNDYEPDLLFYGSEKAGKITPEQMKFPRAGLGGGNPFAKY